MKQTIYLENFIEAFHRFNCMGNFSNEGLEVLFNYLEDRNPDMELDIAYICLEYSENDPASIAADHRIELPENASADARRYVVRDFLEEKTFIIGETKTSFVYESF